MPRLTKHLSAALRPHNDEGAIATIVAIVLAGGVLMGILALSVDVGQLYAERRQLQNGADAASLAVAQDCAAGKPCDAGTSASSVAGQYANANSNDNVSQVTNVCGRGRSTLAACAAPSASIYDCPALPASPTSFVQVRTATLTSGGSTLLPPTFARLLLGNSAYPGKTVTACAQAAWGPPKTVRSTLPVTISLCEWRNYTASGTNYAPPPPYAGYPSTYEHVLYLHNTKGATNCPAGPSGSDLPGGFGWLNSSNCIANIDANSWVNDNTGVSINSDCKGVIAGLVGTVVYIPIYDGTNNLTGSNGSYHIQQFAAFYLTGYALPAAQPNSVKSIATGTALCKGSDKCLYGWFTTGTVPGDGGIGTGPSLGANIVQLVG
jgi:Flp pilus assembly protein TadG